MTRQTSGSSGRAALAPLLSAAQVAEYLHISKSRVYELLYAGAFGPVMRLGPRRIRIRPQAVERFLQSAEAGQVSNA